MEDEIGGEDLDTLFERYNISGSAQEKEALAESYLDLFHEYSYDFACGKLGQEALNDLTSFIEKIESLQGIISWSLRAQAYEMLMENAEERLDSSMVLHYGHLSIEASLKQISQGKESPRIYYEKISFCYYTLLSFATEEKHSYWEKSLSYAKEAILENPRKANWIQYFRLIYSFTNKEIPSISNRREEEKTAFRAWARSLEKEESLAFVIASELIRFKDITQHSESNQFIFPELEYLFWLEKSLLDGPLRLSAQEVSSMGHFYQKEGARLQRIDLLERALGYFEILFYEHSEPFAIYYATDVLEKIAEVYHKMERTEKADAIIIQALKWNEDKQEYFHDNFSLLLHYSEFLERCFHYKGNIPKPALSLIKSVTQLAEAEGKGFYSGPYFIQARMALVQRKESLAMAFLCKSLLLHELCIEDQVVQFYKYLPKGTFPYLENFTATTLLFMKSISEGYFYNPIIRYAELTAMSDDEVIEAWILRKAELKRRRKK